MTLIVHAYRRDPVTHEMVDLDVEPQAPRNDLAGLESWRQTIYGSPTATKLGLTLLASLRTDDIRAEGGQLDRLKSEVETLREHLDDLTDGDRAHAAAIQFRIDNILEAIRLATSVSDGSGGVYIG